MWGIGTYWTLVELTAEQIKDNSEIAESTLIVSELLGFLGCKRNKLETFLEHSRNVGLFNSELNGNILKINIPKLLEFADNYIKYDGKSLKTLQREKEMSSKQEENKNRTEEKKKEHKSISAAPPVVIPSELNTPEFIEAWSEFKAMRAEIKKPLRGTAERTQLKKLSKIVPAIAVKMVEQSTANQWQGIFELKQGTNNAGTFKGNRQSDATKRATFTHGPEQIQRLRELEESLERRVRERGERI